MYIDVFMYVMYINLMLQFSDIHDLVSEGDDDGAKNLCLNIYHYCIIHVGCI